MNKLPVCNDVRLSRAGAGPTQAAARAKARPSGDLVASIRTLGKTAMIAVEVAEIIGFGLALL